MSEQDNRLFVCPYCGDEFDDHIQLAEHMRTEESLGEPQE